MPFGVDLGCFLGVMLCVQMVTVGHVRVVARLLMLTFLIGVRRLLVMPGGALVMFRRPSCGARPLHALPWAYSVLKVGNIARLRLEHVSLRRLPNEHVVVTFP